MLKTVRNCWSIAAQFVCTISIKNRTNETSSSKLKHINEFIATGYYQFMESRSSVQIFEGESKRNFISKINPENLTILQQCMFSYI